MRTIAEILNHREYKQFQIGGYYNQPYNFNQQFSYIPSTIIPELGQIILDTKADFKDNKKSAEQILKERKDKLIGFGVTSAFGLLSAGVNANYNQNQLQRQRELNQDNYVPIAADNRYNSHVTDSYQQYETGGIPNRYKDMGFTKVGEKKKSTIEGKKWSVLAKKGDKYKVVHGGSVGMEDYSQHHDEDRRKRFWDRMGGKNSAKANDPFSPLSWHKKFGTWQVAGEYKPNIQTLGNIQFDSDTLVNKGNYFIAKDTNTGRDYGVVKNKDGQFDFFNSTQSLPENTGNLGEVQVTKGVLYDYQKTKNNLTGVTPIDKSSFPLRAAQVAKDYVQIQTDKKENNAKTAEYQKLLDEAVVAEQKGDMDEFNRLNSAADMMTATILPHLDCLGSSCMYTDRYFKKDYGLNGMGKIKERLLKHTNQNDAGMAAWNIFGAMKKDNPNQIDYAPELGKDAKYNNLPQEVKDKIVVGTNIGFSDGITRNGINSEQGIQDTRHHAIVIGFDKDKTPILFDYGEAKRLDNPKFNWNIGAIATPQEYKDANINSDEYAKNPVSYDTNLKGYDLKDGKATKAINEISKSLVDNKNMIKEKLGVNDLDYNRLASYLISVSQQETSGYNTASRVNDFFSGMINKNPSLGAFQIKLENAKNIVEKYDLPKDYATKSALKDPYKTAVLGMFMAKNVDESKDKLYDQGIAPQQNVVVRKPFLNFPVLNKLRGREVITTEGNQPMSEADKFFYSWNSPNKLRTGQGQGDSRYVKNNKQNLENVQIQFEQGGLLESISKNGYNRDSIYKNNPYNDIYSSNITLANTDIPLMGVSDKGEVQIMYPGNDYHFKDANVVRETPLYESGGYLKDKNTYVTKDGKQTRRGLWANVHLKKQRENSYQSGGSSVDNIRQFYTTQLSTPEYRERFKKESTELTEEEITAELEAMKEGINTIKLKKGKEYEYSPEKDKIYYTNDPELNREESLVHEFSHKKRNGNISYKGKYTDKDNIEMFNQANIKNEHDRDIDERASDLDVLRYKLFKDKVIDSPYKTLEDVDMPVIQEYLNNSDDYFLQRIKRTSAPNKLKELLNTYSNVDYSNKIVKQQYAQVGGNGKKCTTIESILKFHKSQVGEEVGKSKYETIDDDMSGQYNYIDYSEDEKQNEVDDIDFWKNVDDENNLMFSMAEEVKEKLRSRQKDINLDIPEQINYQSNKTNIFPVVNDLNQMGLNPSSVNTGKHNHNSKHNINLAVDLGLNTTFGGDTKKMESFLTTYFPQLQQKYPTLKLRDERTKPNGQKVWSGSHYHLEL